MEALLDPAEELLQSEELTETEEMPPVAQAVSEEPDPVEEPEPLPAVRKKTIRAEWVMGIIAGACALLLIGVIILCMPYFGVDEDPDHVAQRPEPQQTTLPIQPTILEPTVAETEPENPTIPPDPNPYDRYDFQYNRNNYLLLQNVHSSPGVDVSAYQGKIDWKAVKASGIEFAMIRLGYRGYESGKLVKDEYAVRNLEGARAAGLKVGAYFFSQALNTKEVDEEIAFMMDVLDGFLPDMHLVLDWEIPADSARTKRMDARTLTDIQLHYCSRITEKGYMPMVYFNWHQSENLYYLSELEEYPFWLALYQDRMTYPWRVEMWQYTDRGTVPGIQGNVDINVYMPY